MRIVVALLSLLLGWLPVVNAQHLDHFDLVLFSLNQKPDSTWHPFAPRFLTGFNPKGYNNQPQFFSSSELYLTMQDPADTTQTDIFALDLLRRTTTRITATKTPEYSPTLMPGGRQFSAVRVEEGIGQRLWAFPCDRSDNGRPIFPNITNIGYHCWLRDTLAAVFQVGEDNAPHALALVGIEGQKPVRIAFNIGRCLQKMPDGRLAYVHKATDSIWFLKSYDPVLKGTDILVRTLPGSEDFTVLPDGTFIVGNGTKLYQYQPRRQQEWKEIADLKQYGVKSITRLACSLDGKLVVVVQ
ncbi:MAG: hypothetical protein EP344_13205 [Bacteroidetes bacterium]|nr:MAG: hypothetical protein EP344_13205 [Bacteroidota bacterium]